MPMILAYGNFVFQTGDPTLAIVKNVIESDIGERIGYTERWTISGELLAGIVVQNEIIEIAIKRRLHCFN
jgi:hypothetical protein